eukprot:TRINITY_DN27928_c0_g1_i1.p1 TRINITY_DN27928_c0_g1~~TRINITY_DN27928_c0_g1_i1.p1  ORF type:complete len:337 (-),score=77.73 TRINITY_DN27928_c0_g1_i1:152-1162(-)
MKRDEQETAELLAAGERAEAIPQSLSNGVATVAYICISSSMLIVNKAAVAVLPYPYFVTNLQMFVSALVIYGMKMNGSIDFPHPDLAKIKSWVGVTTAWLLPIVANMQALQLLNVETVLVFRTMTVLGVALGDYLLLGNRIETIPLVGLFTITIGGITYGMYDVSYNLAGYIWAVIYWATMVINALYIKAIFIKSESMTTWEKSFLSNVMTVPVLTMASAYFEGVPSCVAALFSMSAPGMMVVALSCVMGLGISVAGTRCRESFSATGFDVLGNMNKFISIGLSRTLLGSVVSSQSLIALIVALGGGFLYSPLGTKCVNGLMGTGEAQLQTASGHV